MLQCNYTKKAWTAFGLYYTWIKHILLYIVAVDFELWCHFPSLKHFRRRYLSSIYILRTVLNCSMTQQLFNADWWQWSPHFTSHLYIWWRNPKMVWVAQQTWPMMIVDILSVFMSALQMDKLTNTIVTEEVYPKAISTFCMSSLLESMYPVQPIERIRCKENVKGKCCLDFQKCIINLLYTRRTFTLLPSFIHY